MRKRRKHPTQIGALDSIFDILGEATDNSSVLTKVKRKWMS
jgi:hypothetical protein